MVALIGCRRCAVGLQEESMAEKYHPAKIDSTEVKGIMRVTLDAQGRRADRPRDRPGPRGAGDSDGRNVTRKVIPYGALMYDTKGDTWTFTSPKPLVVRPPAGRRRRHRR